MPMCGREMIKVYRKHGNHFEIGVPATALGDTMIYHFRVHHENNGFWGRLR